jgi:hypothetical protein
MGAVVAIATDRDLKPDGDGHDVRSPGRGSVRPGHARPPHRCAAGGRHRAPDRPGRFTARERVEWTATDDREADVASLCQRITDVLCRHIAEAPEQWWGAFQPVWADLARASRPG